MIRTIFVDLGEVLVKVNFNKLIRALVNSSDKNEYELALYISESNIIRQYREGNINTDLFLDKFRSDINFHGNNMELQEVWCDIFEPIIDNIRIMSKLIEQYDIVLTSNTNPLHVQKIFSMIGNIKFFNRKIFSYEIGISKPDRKFYEYALKVSSAIATESVFIDDLEENIAVARELGFASIKIDSYSDLKRELIKLGISI